MSSLREKFSLRRASIYAAPGNPAETLPLVYGNLTDGDQGSVPATEIQKWNGTNQVFLISDSPIDVTAPTVYEDNVAIATGWTFNASNNFESQGNVATLTFTVDKTGKQISVRCKGIKNAGGMLIENLAEIIRDLIEVKHGVPTTEWDSVQYSRAFNDCADLGYLGGGVVLNDFDPVSMADTILDPIGSAFPGGDGKLKLFIQKVPTVPTPDEIFDAHEVDRFNYEISIDEVVNNLLLNYRFNWRKRRFASIEKHFDASTAKGDTQSQVERKVRFRELSAPWLRTSAAGAAAASQLISLWKNPRAKITFSVPGSKACLIQLADLVAFTTRKFPGGSGGVLPGEKRVMRVQQAIVGSARTELTGLDLEKNWWVKAYRYDGTYKYERTIHYGGDS